MIVYVAAPYSNVADKQHLMTTIEKFCAEYMLSNKGCYTITGLVHHYACQHNTKLGTDWKFWKEFCEMFLLRCDRLVIIMYPGWKESNGVKEEIKFALDNNIPVEYHSVT